MVLAPFPRLALIDQKITPALVSFDSLSGISRVDHLVSLIDYWPCAFLEVWGRK